MDRPMKKIKICPDPHLKIKIHVSDQMVKDFKKCGELAESVGRMPRCDVCSWKDVRLGSFHLCGLEQIERAMKED